jgi:hypothetical protein
VFRLIDLDRWVQQQLNTSRRRDTSRGLGRVEDLAGAAPVVISKVIAEPPVATWKSVRAAFPGPISLEAVLNDSTSAFHC